MIQLSKSVFSKSRIVSIPVISIFIAFTAQASQYYDRYGNTCDSSNSTCYDYSSGRYYQDGTVPVPYVNMLTPADGQSVGGVVQLTVKADRGTLTQVVINSNTGYQIAIPASAFQYNNGVYSSSWDTTTGPNAGDYRLEAQASNRYGNSSQAHQVAVNNAAQPSTPAQPSAPAQVTNSAVFNPTWYLQAYPDLQAAFGGDTNRATQHWLSDGFREGRHGSAAFNVQDYAAMNPDLQNAFAGDLNTLALHWVTNGANECRASSQTFSVCQYMNMYPDLQAAFGGDRAAAAQHYNNSGVFEGRAGLYALRSEVFNAAWYLQNNPDLQAAFGGDTNRATQHWLQSGIAEGRQGTPGFTAATYLARYPDVSSAYGSRNFAAAIEHFVLHGLAEGRYGN